jgi:hypothetical protein
MGLFCLLVVLVAVLAVLSYAFQPNFNRRHHRIHESHVYNEFRKYHRENIHQFSRIYQMAIKPPNAMSDFAIGDYVVAKVSDFKGSLNNPLVEFTVNLSYLTSFLLRYDIL